MLLLLLLLTLLLLNLCLLLLRLLLCPCCMWCTPCVHLRLSLSDHIRRLGLQLLGLLDMHS